VGTSLKACWLLSIDKVSNGGDSLPALICLVFYIYSILSLVREICYDSTAISSNGMVFQSVNGTSHIADSSLGDTLIKGK
jgi:hypothetical protein